MHFSLKIAAPPQKYLRGHGFPITTRVLVEAARVVEDGRCWSETVRTTLGVCQHASEQAHRHRRTRILPTKYRGEVTALKPVRAEQVKRPERKQNWTVPHCGSVLPICLSLRPVGPIHIIIETVLMTSCSPRADICGPNCQNITPLIM